MQLRANRLLHRVKCLAKILQIIAYYEAIICLEFYLRLFEAVLLAFLAGALLLFGADRFAADLLLFGADLVLTALLDRFAIMNL